LTYKNMNINVGYIHRQKEGRTSRGYPERNRKMSKDRNHFEGVSTKSLERGQGPRIQPKE